MKLIADQFGCKVVEHSDGKYGIMGPDPKKESKVSAGFTEAITNRQKGVEPM